MLVLIDGYNLLHASTILPPPRLQGSLEATRAAVLDFLIQRLPPQVASQTTVVFDKGTERGLPARTRHGPLAVRFAIHHSEADDLLEQLIAAHHAPRRLTVVSSDHRVQRAARRRRARTVDSDVWLRELTRPARADDAEQLQSPETPADWRQEFADLDLSALEREIEQAEDRLDLPEADDGEK